MPTLRPLYKVIGAHIATVFRSSCVSPISLFRRANALSSGCSRTGGPKIRGSHLDVAMVNKPGQLPRLARTDSVDYNAFIYKDADRHIRESRPVDQYGKSALDRV